MMTDSVVKWGEKVIMMKNEADGRRRSRPVKVKIWTLLFTAYICEENLNIWKVMKWIIRMKRKLTHPRMHVSPYGAKAIVTSEEKRVGGNMF